jgi:hypothetical protein
MYIYIYIYRERERDLCTRTVAVIGRVHVENVNGKQAVYGHERHLLDVGTHR